MTDADMVARSQEILHLVLGDGGPHDFAVRFWDGTVWGERANPRFTLVLNHPEALRRMVSANSDLGASEAFLFGDVDVEGDLEALFELAAGLGERDWLPAEQLRLLRKGMALPSAGAAARDQRSRVGATMRGRKHSRERDRQAIAYHYDVSNRFYSLWLDERMVYSCGYFRDADDDLDDAQVAKLDHICRKLRLAPGERFLDIGCGWGALAMHAAKEYGAEAVGVTLSERQYDLARERIGQAGLQDSCRVELMDYRDVATLGTFDKIASVGMFEHVGEAMLPTYFKTAFDVLRPGGLFLNHGISHTVGPERRRRGPSSGDIYVFPDGELVPISHALSVAEETDFEVRDVESLRERYAETLRHWVRRLEAHESEAVAEVGEEKYRVWRLFMAASANGFASGRLNVYQALLSKPREDGRCELPPTREDLYA